MAYWIKYLSDDTLEYGDMAASETSWSKGRQDISKTCLAWGNKLISADLGPGKYVVVERMITDNKNAYQDKKTKTFKIPTFCVVRRIKFFLDKSLRGKKINIESVNVGGFHTYHLYLADVAIEDQFYKEVDDELIGQWLSMEIHLPAPYKPNSGLVSVVRILEEKA